jgi:hypothetical protein
MRGRAGTVVKEFLAPDRLRVEIVYPDRTEVRILDGKKGWRGSDRQLQRVDGPPLLATVYQALRSNPPWILGHYRELLTDHGTLARDNRQYRGIGLPWSGDLDLIYWVDEANLHVVRVEASLTMGSARTVFATAYDDFRPIEGVLWPFAEENFAGGRHTGSTRVTAVTFDPPEFRPFDPTRLPK